MLNVRNYYFLFVKICKNFHTLLYYIPYYNTIKKHIQYSKNITSHNNYRKINFNFFKKYSHFKDDIKHPQYYNIEDSETLWSILRIHPVFK